jgi:hypothetical protein
MLQKCLIQVTKMPDQGCENALYMLQMRRLQKCPKVT